MAKKIVNLVKLMKNVCRKCFQEYKAFASVEIKIMWEKIWKICFDLQHETCIIIRSKSCLCFFKEEIIFENKKNTIRFPFFFLLNYDLLFWYCKQWDARNENGGEKHKEIQYRGSSGNFHAEMKIFSTSKCFFGIWFLLFYGFPVFFFTVGRIFGLFILYGGIGWGKRFGAIFDWFWVFRDFNPGNHFSQYSKKICRRNRRIFHWIYSKFFHDVTPVA